MQQTLTIYLDTSVISAYFDPEEQIEWLAQRNKASLEKDGYELRPHSSIPNCN